MKDIDENECNPDDFMSEVGDVLYLASSLTSLHSEKISKPLVDTNAEFDFSHSQHTLEKLIENNSDYVIRPTDQNNNAESLPVEKEVKEASERQKTKRPFKGYFYLLVSAFLYALTQILMKMAYTVNGMEHATIRYLIQLIVMIVIIYRKKKQIFGPKNRRKLLISRAIVGVTGLAAFFCSIKFINPSDAAALSHSSLIITSILARIFLKEMLTIYHIIATILTLLGVVLISKPSFLFSKLPMIECSNCSSIAQNETINLALSSNLNGISTAVGVSLAMIGAMTSGIVFIILKKLSNKDIHYSITTFYAAFLGLPICLFGSMVLFLAGLTHRDAQKEADVLKYHVLLSFTAGALGVISQMLMILSFKYVNVSVISTVKTIDVLIAFLLQYMILNIPVNIVTVAGATAILFGIFIIFLYALGEKAYKSYMKNQVKSSKGRKVSKRVLKVVFFKF
jgi:drug/metabolite transporter (DMT)-like permease